MEKSRLLVVAPGAFDCRLPPSPTGTLFGTLPVPFLRRTCALRSETFRSFIRLAFGSSSSGKVVRMVGTVLSAWLVAARGGGGLVNSGTLSATTESSCTRRKMNSVKRRRFCWFSVCISAQQDEYLLRRGCGDVGLQSESTGYSSLLRLIRICSGGKAMPL